MILHVFFNNHNNSTHSKLPVKLHAEKMMNAEIKVVILLLTLKRYPNTLKAKTR